MSGLPHSQKRCGDVKDAVSAVDNSATTHAAPYWPKVLLRGAPAARQDQVTRNRLWNLCSLSEGLAAIVLLEGWLQRPAMTI